MSAVLLTEAEIRLLLEVLGWETVQDVTPDFPYRIQRYAGGYREGQLGQLQAKLTTMLEAKTLTEAAPLTEVVGSPAQRVEVKPWEEGEPAPVPEPVAEEHINAVLHFEKRDGGWDADGVEVCGLPWIDQEEAREAWLILTTDPNRERPDTADCVDVDECPPGCYDTMYKWLARLGVVSHNDDDMIVAERRYWCWAVTEDPE